MTEKQIILSNLTRKQRIARRRALTRRDGEVLVRAGIILVGAGVWKRPMPLANPIPIK